MKLFTILFVLLMLGALDLIHSLVWFGVYVPTQQDYNKVVAITLCCILGCMIAIILARVL